MTTENSDRKPSRRRILLLGAAATSAAVVIACKTSQKSAHEHEEEEEKVTPGEDLMQEHGVLKRILLIYAEAIHRIDNKKDLAPEPVKSAAQLVRSFVEDYHEKNEENFLFPRLKKANKEVQLVDTLLAQHQAGRRITDRIITLSTLPALKDATQARELSTLMQQFIRMYQVHEAREDTVLFPAFRDLLTKHEYDALGEEFEKQEHAHFGADGFELAVDQVAGIEKQLGIYDLAQFTPPS